MLPYLFVFSVCILLCTIYKDNRRWPIWVVCILLSSLAGFRDKGVGTDTLVYTDQYFQEALYCDSLFDVVNNDTGLDVCFLALAYFASLFTHDIWLFYFLIEFVISIFIILAFIRLSKNYKIHPAVFLLSYMLIVFNYSLNAMRQECAMSIVLFAYSYILERKWIPYIFFSFIAFLFHSTTIITLVLVGFYVMSNIENEKVRALLIVLSLAIMVVAINFYYELLNYLGEGSNSMMEHFANGYGINSRFDNTDRIPKTELGLALLGYFVMYLSYRRRIIAGSVLSFHFIINSVFLLSLFLSYYNIYAYRIGLYFLLISILLWSMEMSSNKIKLYEHIIVYFIVLFYWVYSYIFLGNSETIPYTSRILGV